jgi:cytochrome c peroxidase
MKKVMLFFTLFALYACSSDNTTEETTNNDTTEFDLSSLLDIDFSTLFNYNDQYIPVYINQDNTPLGNEISNEVATLGRILFYDNNLSTTNAISCASCHKQGEAFGDTNVVSTGVDGTTGRHSMRLVNARFSNENNFFWDERANTLEEQTTMPIQDHIEMGFSGENGDPDFNDLIVKLKNTSYYETLFEFAFGTTDITETRIQNALAQFIRSIQSFDSKYDEGRLGVNNDNQPFLNFTAEENLGKQLFFQPPNFDNQGSRVGGGIGCAGCHRGSEFSIDPDSRNNGVIGNASGTGLDLTNTRSPSLRDIVKANGDSNGPMMHTGSFASLNAVLNHYNGIDPTGNNTLDNRLRPNGNGQQLNLTLEERDAVIAFLRTLAGTEIYTDEKWSNPFL